MAERWNRLKAKRSSSNTHLSELNRAALFNKGMDFALSLWTARFPAPGAGN